MAATHKNRLSTTISAVASAGLGALTISTASSGYRTFGAGDNGLTFDGVTITEGTTWECRGGCVYTHAGTSLARGTLMDSSTGSAIAFTAAAVVIQGGAAELAAMLQLAMASIVPGGRLTLETGVPVSTTDQTAKTSIFYTPYVTNVVPLWDGYKWTPIEFTEKTLALGTLISARPYDVFGYLSAGALVLELLAWTSGTARATAVTLQDGRYCKSGDKTRLLLGTFYTTSTTTTEDSGGGSTTQVGGKRFVWNANNQVRRRIAVIDTADNWSYTTGTWRQANAATGNKVEYVTGDPASVISAQLVGSLYLSGTGAPTRIAAVGIGMDSITVPSGLRQSGYLTVTTGSISGYVALGAAYCGGPGLGYHYLAELEYGSDHSASCLFIGDNVSDGQQTGLIAEVFA